MYKTCTEAALNVIYMGALVSMILILVYLNIWKPNVAGMGPQFKIMVRIQNAGDSLSDIPLVMSPLAKRCQETFLSIPQLVILSVNQFDNLIQFIYLKSNNSYTKKNGYLATWGFPKNDHFGVFWGYHHLRKHPLGHNFRVMWCFVVGWPVRFHISERCARALYDQSGALSDTEVPWNSFTTKLRDV